MPPTIGWARPGLRDDTRDHIVQLYRHDEELVEKVASYAWDALRREDAMLFFATRQHCSRFRRSLSDRGLDVRRAELGGQLCFIAVEDILPRFYHGQSIDKALFQALVNELLARTSAGGRFHHIHVFGEIVNILWEQGNLEGTLRLEQLWNQLQRARPFTLYCAFHVDKTAKELVEGPMRDVLSEHSRLRDAGPDADGVRVPRGVLVALADLDRGQAQALAPQIRSLLAPWAPDVVT